MHKLCAIFAFAGLLGSASAQEPLDETSAALLAGGTVSSNDHPAPASLRLPSQWLQQFKTIAAQSDAAKVEVGACLARQVSAELVVPNSASAVGSHACADQLARSDGASSTASGLACAQPAWTVGPIELGHPLSIDLTQARCAGVTVGDVHAHPRLSNAFFTYYLPSDTDVIRRRLSSVGWLSAVVNDEGMCVVLNGRGSAPDDMDQSSSHSDRLYGLLFSALLSGTPDDSAAAVDVDRFETSWAGQAYAERVGRVISGSSSGGGALYCGRFGEPLRRRAESEEAALGRQDSAIAQVAAKAVVIAARWLYQPQWAPIDFAWSDQEDPAFRRYLAGLAKSGDPAMVAARLDAERAALLQRAPATTLLQLLWPLLKDPDSGRPPALSFWSFRAPRESGSARDTPHRISFLVARAREGWTYQIDSFDAGSGRWRTVAQTWPGRKRFFLVQREGARYKLHEEDATYVYDGDAIAAESAWERTGHGLLVVGTTRYEGSFDHGQMNGPGTMDGVAYRYEGRFEHNRPVGPGRLYVKETKSWHDVP